MKQRDDLRNIAIIAHVDHGKTTLVDKLLQQSGAFRQNEQVEERVMDSNDLERERGITILAKNTAIRYLDKTINIVDTPGHADFGGEVERILRMVDGCLLLVDAFEGVMPQTKFVLRKAMAQGLKIIVVINKIDRPMARPAEVLDETLELFMELEADDDQLEFPVIYASALNGISGDSPDKLEDNMKPLFEAILEHIPVPVAEDGPLQVQVTTLDYSDYLGKIGIGRIHRGAIRMGQTVAVIKRNGSVEKARVTKLMGYQGLKRVDIDEASAGDIVAYAGLGEIEIGETVADSESPEALPLITIDEPTVRMTFLVNDAPFAGREGKHVTSRKLRERLYKEMEKDVALRVEDTDSPEEFLVAGRGELHLSILIEKMRREGYEMAVSKPEVILREEEGQILEPVERAIIDVPEEFVGTIIEKLGSRKGEMVNMTTYNGQTRLEFLIPARGLIGFRNEFLTDTRGHGIINSSFDSYQPLRSTPVKRRQGALIAWETGKATSYGLQSVEDRGILFIEPGDEVYEGMIVGQNAREQDLDVNVCKQKAMTNVRSSTKEQTDGLKSARKLSLEEALEFLNDDEFCEITPLNIRLRKKYLQKHERERMAKTKK